MSVAYTSIVHSADHMLGTRMTRFKNIDKEYLTFVAKTMTLGHDKSFLTTASKHHRLDRYAQSGIIILVNNSAHPETFLGKFLNRIVC